MYSIVRQKKQLLRLFVICGGLRIPTCAQKDTQQIFKQVFITIVNYRLQVGLTPYLPTKTFKGRVFIRMVALLTS